MGQMQRDWRRTREQWGEVRPKVLLIEDRRWRAQVGAAVAQRMEDWAAMGRFGDHDMLLAEDPDGVALALLPDMPPPAKAQTALAQFTIPGGVLGSDGFVRACISVASGYWVK